MSLRTLWGSTITSMTQPLFRIQWGYLNGPPGGSNPIRTEGDHFVSLLPNRSTVEQRIGLAILAMSGDKDDIKDDFIEELSKAFDPAAGREVLGRFMEGWCRLVPGAEFAAEMGPSADRLQSLPSYVTISLASFAERHPLLAKVA